MKNLIIAIFALLTFFGCNQDDGIPTADLIAENLHVSKGKYETAPGGTWIEIAESEFEILATALSNVNRCATNATQFTATKDGGFNNTTVCNNNDALKIPANNYLFAFKYNTAAKPNISNCRVKQSTTVSHGPFEDIGPPLPPHDGMNRAVCFVLKQTSIKKDKAAFLGFYSASVVQNVASGLRVNHDPGDDALLSTSTFNHVATYQGLSTPDKQW